MYQFVETTLSCITALHIGCGQDTGVIDLPFVREKPTGFPCVPGSGQRGALRARIEREHANEAHRLLGMESAERAGCISVPDGRLLLFPVLSAPEVFRWVTCPYVLRRYQRDRAYFCPQQHAGEPLQLPDIDNRSVAGVGRGPLMLQEFEFERQAPEWRLPFAVKDVDPALVVLVSDDWFRYFVTYCTVVAQHNRLTAQKTVMKGQLFSVESMPPESVFYGFLGATQERTEDEARWSAAESLERFLQLLLGDDDRLVLPLGGDESTGQGVTEISWQRPNAKGASA